MSTYKQRTRVNGNKNEAKRKDAVKASKPNLELSCMIHNQMQNSTKKLDMKECQVDF